MRPALSIVLATPGHWSVIRVTLQHLLAQTARERLEVLVVTPSRDRLALPLEPYAAFGSLRILELGEFRSIGRANAAGVRQADAALVALAEDHCFPEPEWAQALISAHEEDYAAVGPAIRNANPDTAVSWADLLIGYGPWLWPARRREVEFLPGHNSCYKRDVLLALEDRLESLMEAETLLHWSLRENGRKLLLEPSAVAAHTNFSRWGSLLRVQFFNGRLFAGSRLRSLGGARRWVYVVGSPLIPVVRLLRILQQVRDSGSLRRMLACLHALLPALVLDGAGQFVGYLLGVGNAQQRVADFEFRRMDHITDEDRRRLFGSDPVQ